jgi:hypothetical protein
MNIPDHISESLKTIFRLNILKFGIRNLFDPGSGIRDGKIRIRDKHSGSATLHVPVSFFKFHKYGSNDPLIIG